MNIPLSPEQIDSALQKPEFKKGLHKYLEIQALAQSTDAFHNDPSFRKEFNGFYRIRRDATWQEAFYQIMADSQSQQLAFKTILSLLHKATGQYEASFASKLFATLNPTAPIIDSVVLTLLGLQLPVASEKNHYSRINGIASIHTELTTRYADFLKTINGKYLVSAFKRTHPDAPVSREKMLDLVLWQTRG